MSDFEQNNPYAPPAAARSASNEPLSRDEALKRIRNPAILMLISSIGSLLWGALALATGTGPLAWEKLQTPVLIAAVLLVFFALPLTVIVSSFNVVRGNTRIWPWIAISSGLIPLGTGCVCFSFVFAGWLLCLLLRKDIREALRTDGRPKLAAP